MELHLVPSMYVLNSENKKKEIFEILKQVHKHEKYNVYFSKPITLERKQFANLKNKRNFFLVTNKIDGIRYLLLFGIFKSNGKPFCVMINRHEEIYMLNGVRAPETFFRNALCLDGELAFDFQEKEDSMIQRSIVYWVFGKYCEPQSDASEFTNKIFLQSESNIKTMKTLPLHNLNMLPLLLRQRQMNNYRTDGLVFHSKNPNHPSYKWKPKPSIDLSLSLNSKKETELSWINQDHLESIFSKPLHLDHTSVIDFKIKSNELLQDILVHYKEPLIVEFRIELDESPHKENIYSRTLFLHVIRVRVDKKYPNSKNTIKSILFAFFDHITESEIYHLS